MKNFPAPFLAPSLIAPRSPTPRRSSPLARRATGFTLIEVLVALIVLVLGVLGASAMTLNSLRDSKQSGLRSQASALAYELGDLMRANPPIYSNPPAPAAPILQVDTEAIFRSASPATTSSCWTNGCAPGPMAANDYAEWRLKAFGNGTTIQGVLPNGNAKVCRDASALSANAASYNAGCDGLPTSPLVVKMTWTEKNNNARGTTTPTSVTTVYFNVPLQPY